MSLQLAPEEPEAVPWRVEQLSAVVDAVIGTRPATAMVHRPVILAVDGRSNSGKTTLAARVADAVRGSVVIHTDDIAWKHSRFGWADLLVDGILGPASQGRPVSYRPPRWVEHGRAGSIDVPAGCPLLVIEGDGAGRREVMYLIDALIWVQSDQRVAECRRLARDRYPSALDMANLPSDGSPPDHDGWMAEEIPFNAAQRSWERADIVVCGTPEIPYDPATQIVVGQPLAGRRQGGAFGALLAPAALGTLTSTFTDQRERGRAFAVYGAVSSGGAGVGLILGGLLTQYLSWRYTLYVNLIFAAVAIAGTLAYVRAARPSTRPRLDWPGTVLASAGLFVIVFGFSRAETAGWAAPLTITCLVVGPLLLAAFAVAELRSAHPLLPLRVILDRTRGGSYAVLGLTGIALFGVFLFLVYYLQQVKGYSPVVSGLLFLPFVGGILLSSTASSIVLPRVGPRVLIASGMVLSVGAMAYLTQLTVTSSYAAVILPAIIIMGLGFGIIFAVTINTATAGVRPQDAGVASALVNTMQQVGGSIGLSALSTVALTATATYLAAHHTGPLAPAIAATHGYTTAFAISTGILGLGVILAIALLPSRRRPTELRTAAAEPGPAVAAQPKPDAEPQPKPQAEPQPEPQSTPRAIPVALCSCSPVIKHDTAAPVAGGRGSPLVRS